MQLFLITSVLQKTKCFYFCPSFYEKFIYKNGLIYEHDGEVCSCYLKCLKKEFVFQKKMKVIFMNWKNFWLNTTMIETVISSLTLFLRKRLREKKIYQIPLHITLNNLSPTDKKSHVKETISLCHCRGHDCIMLVFNFEGFYGTYIRLLSNNYYFRW